MIKRIQLVLAILFVSLAAKAQLGVFNHLGVDLSVGTLGIGIEASTPITDFVQMRAGVSIMPGASFTTSFDGKMTYADGIDHPFEVDLKGGLGRTQGNVVFHVYPFGKLNSFFISAGAYFGGKKVVTIKGHSAEVASQYQQGNLSNGYVEVGDYKLQFDHNGDIYGGLVTKNFRPYLGIGYGRPCPKHRLGFMVELGVQFQGKMKLCQGKNLEEINVTSTGNDDDWQKVMDKLTVYPVLKFTLAGKIF